MSRRELVTAARQMNVWRVKWAQRFDKFFESIKPLDDQRFWELIPYLREQIVGRYSRVDVACDEFYRVAQHPGADGSKYTFDEALQFARAYRLKSKALYEPLFNIIDNRGDDSYGDLLDSLPIIGQEIYDRSLRREFSSTGDFEREVERAVVNIATSEEDLRLARFILHGENYVASTLQEQASKRYSYLLRRAG